MVVKVEETVFAACLREIDIHHALQEGGDVVGT